MKYTIDNPKFIRSIYLIFDSSFTGVVKDRYGNIACYQNGVRHRTDGPAILWADGTKEWFINGNRHREDGPAIEYLNGEKSWWYKDKLYGENDEFTTESWIKKCELEIFK